MYVGMSICVCMYIQIQLPEEAIIAPGTDVTGSCEPLYVGAGHETWVLCKSNKHS